MKLKYIFSAVLAVVLSSCSNIDEADRLIAVQIPTTEDDGTSSGDDDSIKVYSRRVLIEDFTGHACINCPEAAEIVESLQDAYAERIVAVSIYSGSFGDPDVKSQKSKTLVTETGKEYWNKWFTSTQGQPIGLINRGKPLDKDFWIEAVTSVLTSTTPVLLTANCRYDAVTRDAGFYVSITGMSGENANLQLWLIENDIVGYQKMPDGTPNYNYVHQHVFRAAVNGTWGEPFTFGEEEKTFEYTYSLDEKWVAENMKLVAFVYNDKGVEQVISVPVVAAPESQE